jgi:hypothetical protein
MKKAVQTSERRSSSSICPRQQGHAEERHGQDRLNGAGQPAGRSFFEFLELRDTRAEGHEQMDFRVCSFGERQPGERGSLRMRNHDHRVAPTGEPVDVAVQRAPGGGVLHGALEQHVAVAERPGQPQQEPRDRTSKSGDRQPGQHRQQGDGDLHQPGQRDCGHDLEKLVRPLSLRRVAEPEPPAGVRDDGPGPDRQQPSSQLHERRPSELVGPPALGEEPCRLRATGKAQAEHGMCGFARLELRRPQLRLHDIHAAKLAAANPLPERLDERLTEGQQRVAARLLPDAVNEEHAERVQLPGHSR